jgi:DNA-binding MarR family transcriptional regulator
MMAGPVRRVTHQDRSLWSAAPDQAGAWPSPGISALDQLLAEPIVQLLMRRDMTDESAVRQLLQEVAVARPALQATGDANTDDPDTILRLLQGTARLWRRRYDRAVSQLPGMTQAQCTVLAYLAQHEGASQVALAQILDIRSATLVRLLDRLEAAGLVARMPDPDDRRAHVPTLTAKARPLIECLHGLSRKAYENLLTGISQAEISQLRTLLCRLRSNLTSHPSEIFSSVPVATQDDA